MFKPLVLSALVALALPISAVAAPVAYTIDPTHTNVLVQWDHFGFSKPSANFSGTTGTIRFDAQQPSKSSVQVNIPINQLQSFVPKLDEHLKAADFFDAGKYPVATFKSSSVSVLSPTKWQVAGQLNLKGVQHPVVLDVTLNKQGVHPMTKAQSIGFDATGVIKRSVFGLGQYAPAVSDEVTLRITTEASVTK